MVASRLKQSLACLGLAVAACWWQHPAQANSVATNLENEPVKLFVLHSYPEGRWSQRLEAGLRQHFSRQQRTIDLRRHQYLDYQAQLDWRNHQARTQEQLAMAAVIDAWQPDAIVVADDEALSSYAKFLLTKPMPLFFTGINAAESKVPGLAQHRNKMTGVFERYPKAMSLRLLRDLTADQVETIAIVTDDSASSRHILDEFVGYFAQEHTQVALAKVFVLPQLTQWHEAIAEINANYDALWLLLPFQVHNQQGQRVPSQNIVQIIAEEAMVPSLSIIDVEQYRGAMAAISVQPEGLGVALGDLIQRGLASPKTLPPPEVYNRGQIMINMRQSNRIGIKIPIEILEYAKVIR